MPEEGWALELCGHRLDLDDIRQDLKKPFDPWSEEHADSGRIMLLLRAKAWNRMEDPDEVLEEAERLIERINGARFANVLDAQPVRGGRLYRFDANGVRRSIVLKGGATLTSRARVRMRATVLREGALPPLPGRSLLQEHLAKAEKDPHVGNMLTFVARSDNWFDLYKAIELVEGLVGNGGARRLGREWDVAKQTASHHRHAPSKQRPLPKNPPSLSEARQLVYRVADRALIGCR